MSLKLYQIVCTCAEPGRLAFVNAPGPITVSPPLNTEVTVASVTQSVVAGQNLKIDYSLNIIANATANWSVAFQIRLYRDTTLINTRYYNRNAAQAGAQYIPMSSTYVDTAPLTLASSTYTVKTIVTTASNITSMTTGTSIDLNIITFA
jgi:hypothetical protein